MNTTKVGYVIALLLLPLLAACGPAANQPAIATPAATATEAPPTTTPTPQPSPSPTPTEAPDPEVTFEQLLEMDASIGSFAQDVQGNLIYNSPLYSTEVGKNIPVVQQYREVGLDGGSEIWIAPEKYPNAPIVVQDLDTGEIRQGPFRYDNDVRRRLTLNDNSAGTPSGRIYEIPVLEGLSDLREVPLTFITTRENMFGVYHGFAISLFAIGVPIEESGHLVVPVKSYVGDEKDFFAFEYNLALGPTVSSNGHWNPYYETFRVGSRVDYDFEDILSGAGNFAGRIPLYEQMFINGMYDVSSRESIHSNYFASNNYYAEENSEASRVVLEVLKTGGFPDELSETINYSEPFLFGAQLFITR
ncbi:MAG: hypothetical protein KJZ53_08185 [Anaerolineales bacterium]|nr:hypothetical protein [Anaerolineales bacterium]